MCVCVYIYSKDYLSKGLENLRIPNSNLGIGIGEGRGATLGEQTMAIGGGGARGWGAGVGEAVATAGWRGRGDRGVWGDFFFIKSRLFDRKDGPDAILGQEIFLAPNI